MRYKGYIGKVQFDEQARIFHGEVINIRDVITFQGASVDELTGAFQESVDDYLAFCRKRGEAPEKPFSGQFLARISPELHRQLNLAAAAAGQSLNAWVTEQLQAAVGRSASRSRPSERPGRRAAADSRKSTAQASKREAKSVVPSRRRARSKT